MIRTLLTGALSTGLAAAALLAPTRASAVPLFGPAPTVPAGIGVPADYVLPPEQYGIGLDLGRVIPLADGKQLTATVRYPTDPATGARAPGPFPVVVEFTTYNGNTGVLTAAITGALKGALEQLHVPLPDNLLDLYRLGSQATSAQDALVKRGYIEVIADVRGTGSSTGAWNPASPQDGQDGIELVDWAAKLPNSSGKVGMYGYSFPGLSGMLTAGQTKPGTPLRAAMMFAVPNDIFRDVLSHSGMTSPVLLTAIIPAVQYLTLLGPVLNLPFAPQVAVQAFVDHLVGALASPDTPLLKLLDGLGANGTYAHDDAWWSERDLGNGLPNFVANDIPTYFVDGYWDLYQDGAFKNYAQLQNLAAGRPQHGPMAPDQRTDPRFQLLQGPWSHLGIGTGPYARMDTDTVTVAWFDRWLKGVDNGIDKTADTLHVVDQTGRAQNTGAYPFAQADLTAYRLGAGTLGDESTGAPDRLDYSPFDNPCNRDNFGQWTAGIPQAVLNLIHMKDPCSAQQLGPRAGVSYTGAPLPEPKLIAGPANLSTYIISTIDEAALQVSLEDVAPDGTVVEITGGAQLATMRTLDDEQTWKTGDGTVYAAEHKLSSADVSPLRAGEVVKLDIRIRPTYYRLDAGHSLRVRITTGNFPTTIAPPVLIPKLLGSSVQILHDTDHPSSLVVPLLSAQ